MSTRNLATLLVLAAGLVFAAPMAQAQSQGQLAPATIQVDQQAPAGVEDLVVSQSASARPAPLGAEMFPAGSGQSTSASVNMDGVIDPTHVLRPGDTVTVTLWGLVNEVQELTIDPQGNVVVSGVGPVRLDGVMAGQAPAVIERAARQVYSSGVQIYATATSAARTQVLVTGPVERPGAYDGAADDSLIRYLQQAGGIDADRGSYRRIRIVRNGETVANVDLYDFLRAGVAPRISFRNGDAVVVEDQGATVAVTGDVRSVYSFELLGLSGYGSEIMQYARPRPGATHVAVVGVRNGLPFSTYMTLDAFAGFALVDGDRVQFESDSRAPDVLVRVEGAHEGASVFSVRRGTTVGQVLQQVQVSNDAEMETLHLRRESVQQTQKAMLDESLDRLQRVTLLAPTRSSGEASARATQAQFVTQYIAEARTVEPLGILALNNRDPNTILLETGDVIVIPSRSQVVTIAGEVQAPQSVLATQVRSVSDYVQMAGGFGPRADRRRVLVFKQDGQIRTGRQVYPGDRVLVISKPESALLPLLGDLAAITLSVARLTN